VVHAPIVLYAAKEFCLRVSQNETSKNPEGLGVGIGPPSREVTAARRSLGEGGSWAFEGTLSAVPLLLVLLLLPLVIVLLIPFSLVQRYRGATARRAARGWVATLNLVALMLSTGFFLAGALLTSVWVPRAFTYALGGVALGGALGLLGLALSHWETTPQSLHYTPNRWLVLAITLVVTSRLLYGFWRAWHAWHFSPDETSWWTAAGVGGSLAAGGVVLGYYLTYWLGIRRRTKWFRRLTEPRRR
jgi:hypothetical protein